MNKPKIKIGPWLRVRYDETLFPSNDKLSQLSHYSDVVNVEADLQPKWKVCLYNFRFTCWLARLLWNRYAVLRVFGPSNAEFVVGYYDKSQSVSRICVRLRTVAEGKLFLVRRGPLQFQYFVLAEESLQLELVRYVNADSVHYLDQIDLALDLY